MVTVLPVLFPIAPYASPFDSGITSIQTLFTSTVARAASLIAIVISGYSFAHGDPEAKKTLAGVAAGTGIAVLAVNVPELALGRLPCFRVAQEGLQNALKHRG
jgi:type IV secretory pathway VirB2 component (pilin)